MRTRIIRSGTTGYASPQEVFSAVLKRFVEMNDSCAWAHFEYRKEATWFRRLIAGISPFVEIARAKDGKLKLNFGLSAKIDPAEHCRTKGVEIPDSWCIRSDGLCSIPVSELWILVEWLDRYFLNVH